MCDFDILGNILFLNLESQASLEGIRMWILLHFPHPESQEYSVNQDWIGMSVTISSFGVGHHTHVIFCALSLDLAALVV